MKAESKAIIFGRYFKSNYVYKNDFGYFRNIVDFGVHIEGHLKKEICYLELKPLSNISDLDAEIIGKYRYSDPKRMTFVEIGKGIISDYLNRKTKGSFELELFEIDFLRLKGYATPQTVIEDGKAVNYSVEELVNEGVFKLDMNKSIESGLCNRCENNKKADTGIYCVECAYEHKMSGY